ncbi:NADP-specific glutamate dehydrogenase, partial [Francisella tularensis subsp. holarctica]|nr:NADP-specific glutamate dehydrogenase [Francisella tularensis subsp. holarctica]
VGKSVTRSGSKGFVLDPKGITNDDKLEFVFKILNNEKTMEDYDKEFKSSWHSDQKPWDIKSDIANPSACQNEIDFEEAQKLNDSGVKYCAEDSKIQNTTEEIALLLKKDKIIDQGKDAKD